MVGAAADRAVIAGLSDAEIAVQRAAVGTLRYRSIDGVLPAVEALLGQTTDKKTRSLAVQGLKAQRKALVRLADSAASERTRASARAMLDRVK
ncbi:MAG: hypothetical protein R3F14_07420 [Polyangiaceae bacterium]